MKFRHLAAIMIVSAVSVFAGMRVANLAYIHATGNIHAVEPGRLYRSATLSAGRLDRLIEETGIRTIVNLRGDAGRPWYEAEREVAARRGVDFISFHISAKQIPDRETLEEIIFVLRNAPQPILVHCKSGSDRAGLVSALYQYALAGQSAEQADRQLSFDYGHFPWLGSRTAAMGEAFSQYVALSPEGEQPPVNGPLTVASDEGRRLN